MDESRIGYGNGRASMTEMDELPNGSERIRCCYRCHTEDKLRQVMGEDPESHRLMDSFSGAAFALQHGKHFNTGTILGHSSLNLVSLIKYMYGFHNDEDLANTTGTVERTGWMELFLVMMTYNASAAYGLQDNRKATVKCIKYFIIICYIISISYIDDISIFHKL